ncbi:MAG: NUDIX hydrolase [Nanobdellota archaeon]
MVVENIGESSKVGRIHFKFYDTDSHESFDNITQSYALCFNEKGHILIIRSKGFGSYNWTLPGGSIEEGETPEKTLHRELMEEADVELSNFVLLGGQVCYLLDLPEEKPMTQLRYVGIIKKLHPQTPDPDNGYVSERKFVSPERFIDYVDWGVVGEHLLKRAQEWFEKQK